MFLTVTLTFALTFVLTFVLTFLLTSFVLTVVLTPIPAKLCKFRQNSDKVWPTSSEILTNLANFGEQIVKNSAIFEQKVEHCERCKGVHCVDLGESFPTHINLQKLASIEPRTSPSKLDS